MIYQLRHKSVVLLENPQFKTISSKGEVLAFLQQFNLDTETLNQLVREGDDKTVPEAWDDGKKLDKVAGFVLAGDIVITQRHNPPKVESSVSALAVGDVGNRPHTLAPAISGSISDRKVLQTAESRPIRVVGDTDTLDLDLMRLDGETIINDAFLSRTRSQLERYDVQVIYNYENVPAGYFGQTKKYLDGGIEFEVYKQNAFTTKQSLETYVHESSHAVAAARGREIGTLADEYQAFRREFLYKRGRRPSLDERRTLFALVQDEYYDVPKGNIAPLFQDLVK
jgi:hypothetical protein